MSPFRAHSNKSRANFAGNGQKTFSAKGPLVLWEKAAQIIEPTNLDRSHVIVGGHVKVTGGVELILDENIPLVI